MLNRTQVFALLFSISPFLLVSCGDASPEPNDQAPSTSDYGGYGDGYGYGIDENNISFADADESNSALEVEIAELPFFNLKGEAVKISELAPDKNLVLVIIRGNTRPICPYCSTQTSRLISNYKKFAEKDAEVIVVYPVKKGIDTESWGVFMDSTRQKLEDSKTELPFPMLFDTELTSISQLGIQQNLSKPATYILDKKRQVHFAYVGSTMADRPSIKAMLLQLDKLNGKENEKTAPEKPSEAETKD